MHGVTYQFPGSLAGIKFSETPEATPLRSGMLMEGPDSSVPVTKSGVSNILM